MRSDVLKQPTLVLYFDPRNGASRAVAVKLGAAQDKDAEAKGQRAQSVYRLFPSRWRDGGLRMTLAPTLNTERLILRAPQMADFDAFAAHCASDRGQLCHRTAGSRAVLA